MTETQRLLAEYAENGSESAFRELTTRYITFVYSTALRLVDGDRQRAEDVAQTVFTHLARNATRVSRQPFLGGWLHRDTYFTASKLMRSERRRQTREREAVLMNSLEDHSEANLDKLQSMLQRRGVALSAVALGSCLTAGAVTAAPGGLAASIAPWSSKETRLGPASCKPLSVHSLNFSKPTSRVRAS